MPPGSAVTRVGRDVHSGPHGVWATSANQRQALVDEASVVETPQMLGRTAEGAAIGGALGAVLISVLVLGRATIRLDAYETANQLVYAGLPLLAVATVTGIFVGALLGATGRRSSGEVAATVTPLVPPGVLIAASAAVIVGWVLVLGATTSWASQLGF